MPLPPPGHGRASAARAGFYLVLAILVLAAAEKQVIGNTLDPDVFWHMRVGAQLLRDGIGPLVDDISFCSIKRPWTPYSWLGELLLQGTWRAGGLCGAVLLGAALVAAVVGMISWACREARRGVHGNDGNDDYDDDDDDLLPVLVASAVGMVLCLRYLALRPVTMAFVLMAACVALLLRDRRVGERSRAVWLVVPLVAVEVNVHFFAAIVPAYVGCLLMGAVWEGFRNRDESVEAEHRRRIGRYTLLTLASAAACLATPMLPGMLDVIAYYIGPDVMVDSGLIVEFGPFYQGATGIVCAVLVAAILVLALVRLRRIRAGELLGMLMTIPLILTYGRFLPIFAIAAAPLLAATLPALPARALRNRIVHGMAAVVILLSVVRIVAALPNPRRPDAAWLNRLRDTKGYPCEAADFVLSNVKPRNGRIINEFGWGGYLCWRLAGQYQVMLDGRTQLYPSAVWRATYLGFDNDLRDFLASTDADAAVISQGEDRMEAALRKLGWKIAYEDARSQVFTPPKVGPGTTTSLSTGPSTREGAPP